MAQRGAPKTGKKPAKKKIAAKRGATKGGTRAQKSTADGSVPDPVSAPVAAPSPVSASVPLAKSSASFPDTKVAASGSKPGKSGATGRPRGNAGRSSEKGAAPHDQPATHDMSEVMADDPALSEKYMRLQKELQQAREEIKLLKGRQDYVLDRIDWAIDSLHSLIEQDE